MDFKTNISYKKLVDRENYKEYVKQVGYKTKRKNEVICVFLAVLYFVFLYGTHNKYPVLINMGGCLYLFLVGYIYFFYTHWLMRLNKKLYKKLNISSDMKVKFEDKYIFLEGDGVSIRLIPPYQAVKTHKYPVKDKFLLYVVETKDKLYFMHTNVNFFFFLEKNEIQLDEMEKLRGQLKEIYKKRYIMK
jgi:hypothetical protein